MGPLIPRPAVTVIALMVTTGMLINIWRDGESDSYDGGQNTLILALLVAGILGFELFRRGGDR